MAEETSAPVAEAAISYALPADAPAAMSVSDAARMLAQAKRARQEQPAESAEPATAEPELAVEANADPSLDPGEVETQEAEPAELPPIERPRSWAKELDEEWASYPREAQEKIAKREQERDAATRRSQNEAAEIRKAAEAERIQAEQARKAYEARLPALSEMLQRQSEFADIKTMDDVRKLQANDPFRFQAWQVYQMDAQTVEGERREAERRQTEQKQSERVKYAQEQDAKLHELIPEMKDPAKANELRTKAVAMLVDDYGFTESELGAIMQTEDGFKLLSDARLQKLIADGLKYSEMLKAPAKAIPKPVPPVSRPGTARGGNPSTSLRIQTLKTQLNTATGTQAIRLAAELTKLQRPAAR